MNAIEISVVTLFSRTQEEMSYDLKGLIIHSLRGRYRKPSRRQVLHDVTCSIQHGEKVGIVGSNGSGKSTLLKIICGILKPTVGEIAIEGRIAPLIELGAGFDPDLSVRENVIFYGVLLGLSKAKVLERLDAILDYAELADRADEPLKSLSSGMNARLGFAIATDEHPDILLLDEVLSVGDESFRAKSAARIQQLWSEHATIVVVSHELGFIEQQCERVLWLRDGTIALDGPPTEVLPRYLASFHPVAI